MPELYVETLTPEGERYAKEQRDESIVARVALQGYEQGWPDEFVTISIKVMNDAGKD